MAVARSGDSRPAPNRDGQRRFVRTKAGLAAAAFLAPLSATRLVGPLTLGRVVALTFAAMLAADLLKNLPRWVRPSFPTALLGGTYVGLTGWVFLNTAAWGCNCDGKMGGFAEVAFVGLLALVAISVESRLGGVAMVAALGGLTAAALLALAGVGSINSGTIDLTQTGGRLSGTFGNSNELGFAVALAIPIAIAYRSLGTRLGQAMTGATLLTLGATLLLTYSRGAIIAAAIGTVAFALWEVRGSRRRLAVVISVAAATAVLAGALYAVFEHARQEASFAAPPHALRELAQRDVTGWDARAMGLIPHGGSALFNQGGAIGVRATGGGEGASFRWGEGRAGAVYTLQFRARSDGATLPFSYALGDNVLNQDSRRAVGDLTRHWRRYTLAWRPDPRSPHATLYVWERRGPSAFALASISLIAHIPGSAPRLISVPAHLGGSLYAHMTSNAVGLERRYIRSRLEAAHLALDAFASEPLHGIGWGTFPEYAAAHSHFGLLAAHDEYLAFAAELGLVGVLLLGLLIAAVVLGLRRIGTTRAEAAALGVLVTAAAGMVFVEALPVPQLSIPIALAAAVACAARGGKRTPQRT
jgi:hypothetical protein